MSCGVMFVKGNVRHPPRETCGTCQKVRTLSAASMTSPPSMALTNLALGFFIMSTVFLRASAQNCQTNHSAFCMTSSSRSFAIGGSPNPLQLRRISSSITLPASPIKI